MSLSLDDLVERNQEAIACPYPIFSKVRAETPIVFNDTLGAWVVTRYDDLMTIIHDTDRFSSRSPTGPVRQDSAMAKAMEELAADPELASAFATLMERRKDGGVLLDGDPPEHRRQRKLVTPAFRPARIRAMEPQMRARAQQLLDAIIDRGDGRAEIMSEFAVALPLGMIAMALGVPSGDMATFKRWSDDLVMPVGNPTPTVDQVRDFLVSNREFDEYFLDKIAQRRINPQEDVLSDVANAEIDGEVLTDGEMMRMLNQFLVAGNETTAKLITNMVYRFALEPELQARVRTDRSLIEGMVEEALRYEAPVGGLFRVAKEPVTVGDVTISEGEHVWLLFAAANRDPEKFDEPDTFDPTRPNAREHVAFGHGEHFCPGASLARAETRIGIDLLLDRMLDITVAPEHVETYENSFVLRGMRQLHIRYTAA
jgi:cytochrome P450